MRSIAKFFLFLFSFIFLTVFSVEAQSEPPTILISVDKSYPGNLFNLVLWQDHKLKQQTEQIFYEGGEFLVDFLPNCNQRLGFSYYTSLNRDERRFLRIYTSPGDEIVIRIREQHPGRFKAFFEGSNAAGHQELAEFTRDVPIVYLQRFNSITYEDDKSYTVDLINFIESHTARFRELLEKGMIDQLYFETVADYIHSIFCRHIVSGFFRERDAIGRNLEYSTKIAIADTIINHFNFGEPNGFGLISEEYANHRIALLRYQYLKEYGLEDYSEIEIIEKLVREASYPIAGIDVPIFLEEDEFLRKYLMAVTLHFGFTSLFGPGFEGTRDLLYYYFQDAYPFSRYLPILEQERKRNYLQYVDFFETPSVSDKEDYRFFKKWSPIIIEDEQEIKGLSPKLQIESEDISHHELDLSDGIYYVTVWATWCGPCIRNFSYNYELDKLLDTYGLQRLYISIDNPTDRYDNWRKVVKDYHLGGYHLLAGKRVNAFLDENYGMSGTVLIPLYFMFNHGSAVDTRIPSPNDLVKMEVLLKELTKTD